MLILHLSDLHFGAHSRFKGEDLAKLGKAFFKDLTAARGSFAKGSRIDLVAVTGDIAESGKPTEFKDGERFLAALAGELGLDRRRFVFVPGNHDVSWPACKKVEADQEEEGFDERAPETHGIREEIVVYFCRARRGLVFRTDEEGDWEDSVESSSLR